MSKCVGIYNPMQCLARLYLADDFGDNSGTYKCQLEEGHTGPHQEVFTHDGVSGKEGKVIVSWEEDEGEDFYTKDVHHGETLFSKCKLLNGLNQSERYEVSNKLYDNVDYTRTAAVICKSCELFSRCQSRVMCGEGTP